MATILEKDYVKVPKEQYNLLKRIYKLNKKQLDLTRIYEVEENLMTWNYKKVSSDEFIASI